MASLTLFPAFLNVAVLSGALVLSDEKPFSAAKRYGCILFLCVVAIALTLLIPGAFERLVQSHAEVAGDDRFQRFLWLFKSTGPNIPLYFIGITGLLFGTAVRPTLLPFSVAGLAMIGLLLIPGEFLPHYVVTAEIALALGVAFFSLVLGSILPMQFANYGAWVMLPLFVVHASLSLPSLLHEWVDDRSVGFWENVELLKTMPEPVLMFQEPIYAIEAGKRITQHYYRAGRQVYGPWSIDVFRELGSRSCTIALTGWDHSFVPDDVERLWEGMYEKVPSNTWDGIYLTHNSGCDE